MVDTTYSNYYGVGALDTPSDLEQDKIAYRKTLEDLRTQYRKQRFYTYRERQNFLLRIREAERNYNAILGEILRIRRDTRYELYTAQEARRVSGIDVTVEVSLDGVVYSNPAPNIPNGKRVWVRAKIDEAHRGNVGVPKTHELVHLTWSYSTKYIKLDNIPASGHDEYFVSFPLIITREFTSPASGTTKYNWLVYADLYARTD